MSEEIDGLWEQLSDSEKEAWGELSSTFKSTGFKLISRDLSETENQLKEAIFQCANWDQYVFLRGQLDAFNVFNNLEARAIGQLQLAVSDRVDEAETSVPEIPVEDFS